MKSSLKYLMLWQKKRNELPFNDDPQTGWAEMQSLLDTHLPVSSEKTSRFKKIKVLPALFIAFSAAAMVYTASRVVINKVSKHHLAYHTGKNYHFNKTSFATDSLSADSGVESSDSTTKQPAEAIQPKKTSIIGTDVTAVANKRAIESTTLNTGQAGAVVAQDKNNIARAPASLASPQNQLVSRRQTNGLSANTALASNNVNSGKGILSASGINSSSSRVANYHHTNHLSNHSNKTNGVAGYKPGGMASEQNLPDVADDNGYQPLQAASLHLNFNNTPSNPLAVLNNSLVGRSPTNQSSSKNVKSTKQKTTRARNSGTSNLDWGILTGVNSSGSFTPKAQNANFYGSFPVDLYLGLFATYHLNSKWGINIQTQIYSPQTINTSYTHANGSKVDSTQTLKITASRKVYNINVPIHIVYNVTDNISIKAGPVIGFPVKQINTNSSLLPAGIRSDTAYYAKSIAILNQTKYEQGINLGFSGGGSIRAGRFIFEATYLKSITGYKIISDWGTYKSNNGTLQFTISFKLNKSK